MDYCDFIIIILIIIVIFIIIYYYINIYKKYSKVNYEKYTDKTIDNENNNNNNNNDIIQSLIKNILAQQKEWETSIAIV